MIKNVSWHSHPPESALERHLRKATAALLRSISLALSRLARRIATAPAARRSTADRGHVEFYAEAGAPEGALYIDGVLVGYLQGIKRL